MAGTAARQLNINLPEATEYTLCPLSFLGKRKEGEYNPFTEPNGKALPRGLIKILSEIYTCRKNFGKNVKITKARLHKKTGLSYGAINAAFDRAINELNLVKETKPNVYKIVPKVNERNYIVLDNYLHTQKFNVSGVEKNLTQSAVLVLELIKSFYLEFKYDEATGEKIYINYNFKSREVINHFKGSEASIAKRLNLPKSTVSDAIDELIHAGLLFRNKRLRYKDAENHVYYKIVHTKGVTGNTLSLFAVPYEVLAVKQSSTYKPQKEEFIYDAEVSDAEIDSAYAALRSEAEAMAEAAREKAFADEEFREAKKELENADTRSEFDGAASRYMKRLAELGISEDELNPQYQCRLCDDTGQNLDTGQRCVCRQRVIETIIRSKFKA